MSAADVLHRKKVKILRFHVWADGRVTFVTESGESISTDSPKEARSLGIFCPEAWVMRDVILSQPDP